MFSTCCAEVGADCIFRVLWEALDGALFVEYSPLPSQENVTFDIEIIEFAKIKNGIF